MILDRIVAHKRAQPSPVADYDAALAAALRAERPVRPFAAALRDRARRAPRVIAEFKRKSPSAGAIRPGAEPAAIAAAYARAGAAAMSVLTDEAFFDGSPRDLQAAHDGCPLPLLRKDFLLDARDVVYSRLCAADAVLLIVRILLPDELARLVALARQLGLGALVEAHDERELETALRAGAEVIGVNHRDLDTLAIDLGLSARARRLVGPEVVLVAESGIQTRADVERMREHEVDAILVGESLMRAPDPGAALAELVA